MSIRSARESDLHRILEVERLSFPSQQQWDSSAFQEALKDLFLVFDDGEISGFLIACCRETIRKAVILRVAVHPGVRNRGIATRLMETAIEKLKERDIREVEIDVEMVRSGAVHLYERIGFRTVRGIPMRENHAMDDENGSFYVMKLVLRNG